MKTITKIGISAIGAAAAAGIGYLGKKMYDKTKNTSTEDITIKVANESETVNTEESSETYTN